uniref:Inactive serine/threonine-protein kinase TEX14-like n=1 Tax=Sciurus vulgaris TaxID=55149 RepID=A0A8D2CSH1_SCIVU
TVKTLLDRRGSSSQHCWATALPCGSCWPLVPTPTSDRCRDGSTPVHAGAFSSCGLVMLHLLQAGGDLRLRDQQGRTPRDWAEQGGAKPSWEVLELLQLCRAHMSALVHGGELAPTASLGQLQTSSRNSLCGSLSSLWLVQADRTLRPEHIRRSPQIPALGFGQLSSLQPLGLVTGIPLVDPKELLPAQGEPDRTYESTSHTLMVNLLWRSHPVAVRRLKVPGAHPDVLLADLQHCRYPVPPLPLASSSPAQHPAPPQSAAADGNEPLSRVAGLPAHAALGWERGA